MNKFYLKDSYLVDPESSVHYVERDYSPDSKMPPPVKNGGLYGGKQSNKPWMPIPVTPTATNYIHNNLRSANPPPGAMEQYVGNIRLGNNYTAKPGIKWYVPSKSSCGPYSMQVVSNTNLL
tara:strand:+ start:182 stop:544 length:363 start_codon:yes stop_codon:yes gene_type:complete